MAGIHTGDTPIEKMSSQRLDVFRPTAHTAWTPESHGVKTAEYIRDFLTRCLQGMIDFINDRNNTRMATAVEQHKIMFAFKDETLFVAEIIRPETVFCLNIHVPAAAPFRKSGNVV